MKTIAQVRNLIGRGDGRVELHPEVAARLDRYVSAITQPEQQRGTTVVVTLDRSGPFRSQLSEPSAMPVQVGIPVAASESEKPTWMTRKLEQLRVKHPEYAWAYVTE